MAFFACKNQTNTPEVSNTETVNNLAFEGLKSNGIIEITDTTQLETIDSAAIKNALKGDAFYNLVFWKNRAIVYTDSKVVEVISASLMSIPNTLIETQTDVLYNFNRTWCDSIEDKSIWKNYILSANLVNDSLKQQEYIAAHNTQRDKWPDVAKGFCHANFQQLQIFKIGRQLVLIIRVPAANTLEELDPKTLENNPKMVEWNNRMKDYQTGLPGTKPGETWVFFK